MSKKGFDCQGPSEREVSLWASHPIRSLLCKIYNALKYTWGDQIANQARCDRLVGVCTVYTQLDDVIKLPSVKYCYVSAPSSISCLPRRRGPLHNWEVPIIGLIAKVCTVVILVFFHTQIKLDSFACSSTVTVTTWLELMSCKKWIMNYLITINTVDPLWCWSLEMSKWPFLATVMISQESLAVYYRDPTEVN